MRDEYQNHTNIDQFLNLIRFVSYRLYRLSHECPQEIVLPVDKAFKLVYTNLGEQDVLHSKEAHEKSLETFFTDSIDLVLISFIGIIATFVGTLLLCITICVVLSFQIKLALFNVFHADVLQQVY